MTPFSMRREGKDDCNELPFSDDLKTLQPQSYMHTR